jgi:hypothetical protein
MCQEGKKGKRAAMGLNFVLRYITDTVSRKFKTEAHVVQFFMTGVHD